MPVLTASPGTWSISNQGTAAAASATKAAGAAGVAHVVTSISITVTCAGTAQTPVVVNLRDGATGVGTVLRTWALAALVGTTYNINEPNLNIAGTAATALTIEFAAATAANVVASVNATGYDTTG
jgi:hypothetical protein